MTPENPETFLRSLFDRAVEVADPMLSLAKHLPPRPTGRVVVVGAGKASARMAEAVERAWGPCEGLVITRYGYARPCEGIEIVEAGHPTPDEAGLRGTERMLDLLETLDEDCFVLGLISGGASSLLVAPAKGISLAEKQNLNRALLASGAPIDKINTVRKHLSKIKGGQLVKAASPAKMLNLIISDVPGDDPAFVGSGPTIGDETTPEDAAKILQDWEISVPDQVRSVLNQPNRLLLPDDPMLRRVENRMIATPMASLEAAAALAQDCKVRVLGDAIEGETREVAREHAQLAREIQASLGPNDRPALLLSGGELTVTRTGNGVGGPNAEYCLAMALELNQAVGIYAIACDTDGVDGGDEVAGAIIGPDTLNTAESVGVDANFALKQNDAHRFFYAVSGQVVTGPTLTNVNDFRAILVLPQV